MCRYLSEEQTKGNVPPFRAAEINAMRLPSPSHAYSLLWEVVSNRRTTETPSRALHLLESHFGRMRLGSKKRRRGCTVLVVDELDYLVTRSQVSRPRPRLSRAPPPPRPRVFTSGGHTPCPGAVAPPRASQAVLYNLFEWAAKPEAQLALVAISNTIDLPERLLPRLTSRMGLDRLQFPAYNRHEIVKILQARIGETRIFQATGMELAARKVASVSGDVRRALDICRRATIIAEEASANAQEPDKSPDQPSCGVATTFGTPSSARGATLVDGILPVAITHVHEAIRQQAQTLPVRAVRALPLHAQLLLVGVLHERTRTGCADVSIDAVLERHAHMCHRQGVARPLEAEARLLGLASQLCASRILSTVAGGGLALELGDKVRTNVEAEEIATALSSAKPEVVAELHIRPSGPRASPST